LTLLTKDIGKEEQEGFKGIVMMENISGVIFVLNKKVCIINHFFDFKTGLCGSAAGALCLWQRDTDLKN
jgi:hypothetical protein